MGSAEYVDAEYVGFQPAPGVTMPGPIYRGFPGPLGGIPGPTVSAIPGPRGRWNHHPWADSRRMRAHYHNPGQIMKLSWETGFGTGVFRPGRHASRFEWAVSRWFAVGAPGGIETRAKPNWRARV